MRKNITVNVRVQPPDDLSVICFSITPWIPEGQILIRHEDLGTQP